MNSDPLVTIVTPSFNQGRFITATIDSVLSQDYPNVEYIVMDGGSTDETGRVVEPYRERLTYLSEKDRGQSHAINKGFAMARGEIVAWLNSDDVFLPGAISAAVKAFQRNPTAAVVYGEGYQIDVDGNVKSKFPHTQEFDLWRLAHMSDYILQQSTFFRKRAFNTVGFVREDLHYIMDWELLIRIGKEFDFAYIPELLGCLREYSTAKTFTGGAKRAAEIREVLKAHTGKTFAEGYIVYGLDIYSQIWSQRILNIKALPASLRERIAARIIALSHRVLGRVATHAQGLYADGWLSKKAHFMLRRGTGEIVVRGAVPEIAELSGQVLTVRCEGVKCVQSSVGPGAFEVRFTAPHAASKRALAYDVIFEKSVSPARTGSSADSRLLSATFGTFSWAKDNDGKPQTEGHTQTNIS